MRFVLIFSRVGLILISLVGEVDDEVLVGGLDRSQSQRLKQDVAESERFSRTGIDPAAEFQTAEFERVEAKRATEDLGKPVAKRLLLCDRSLKLKLRFRSGTEDRGDGIVGDLSCTGTVTNHER